MIGVLRKIRDLNIRCSEYLTPRHIKHTHAYKYFDLLATIELLDERNRVVLDVGAGKQFHLADALRKRSGVHLIGQDIDIEEMRDNPSLAQLIAGDACEGIDLADDSVDLVLARATIEHLHDVRAFLREVHRVLRPGGKIIVTFANRWATFAILNRLLPVQLKHKLLRALMPGSEGTLGFQAFYDASGYGQFRALLKQSGFEEVISYSSYYGMGYFRFCVPLYLLAYSIDTLRYLLSIPSLGSYNTFMFEKPVALEDQASELGLIGAVENSAL